MDFLLHAVANKIISAKSARAMLRQGFTAEQIMRSVTTPALELSPQAEAAWCDSVRA